MLRLQQVLSGHIITDNGDLIELKSKRLDALLEIVQETEGKILIWSRFRNDIQRIYKTLEDNFPGQSATYYGSTPDDERQEIVTKFQDPEATTVIYYANDFNLETRIQSEDRCHRIGQKNPVTYIDLITENTIDEAIVRALRDKIDLGAKVLGEEAREWLTIKPTK